VASPQITSDSQPRSRHPLREGGAVSNDEADGLVARYLIVKGKTLRLIVDNKTEIEADVTVTAAAPTQLQLMFRVAQQPHHMRTNRFLAGSHDAVRPARWIADLEFILARNRHA
jgi:hypothetical protein